MKNLIILLIIAFFPGGLMSQQTAKTFDIGKRKVYYDGKKIKKLKEFKRIVYGINDPHATGMINKYEKAHNLSLIPMIAGDGLMLWGLIDAANGESPGTKVLSGALLLTAGVIMNRVAWKKKGKPALERYNQVVLGNAETVPFDVPQSPGNSFNTNGGGNSGHAVGLPGFHLFAGLNLMADPFDLGYSIRASYQLDSEKPVLIAPFFEAFTNNHENYRSEFKTQYYGASLVYMPQPEGFYAGLGLGGSTRKFSIVGNRFSVSVSPQVGYIRPINTAFGVFAEARYYWNQRSKKDLEEVKRGERSSLYIFDNDLKISIGMYHRLGS